MALLPSDPQQQRKLLIGLVPLLGLFAYWYFYHGDKKAEIASLESRLESLETKNAAARARAQRGPLVLWALVCCIVTPNIVG